ncbi:MAG: YhbY family RNA-binding protein [Candidatus Helarchaeota archaeon]
MKKIKNPKKAELVKRIMASPPAMNIGKNGITDQVILEIKTQLKLNRIIKIKFLKSILEIKKIQILADEIIQKTKSKLVDLRGHNIIISKK